MKTILIADDEERIRKLVGDFLKRAGYSVMEAEDGDSAFRIFENNKKILDLIIIDIMMPGLNGWELCRKIRETSNVPIIILSARSEEFDELTCYESGADDYVTKPFSPIILVKRVEALLRRASSSSQIADREFNDLIFNDEAHEVRLEGKEVELTLKEYNILKMLLQDSGRVFSREQLLDGIWGYDFTGDIRTVDSHVARLRTKLGEWGNKHLKTVYGVGYKIEES